MKASAVWLLGVVLVPVLALAQAPAADVNTITAVQVNGGTVSITGTKKPNFTTFTMTDPPRLVIDISEAVFSGVPEEVQVGNGTVTGIRTASYGSDASAIARVLIGYEREVETDIQANGNQLVVKVTGGAGQAVAQAPAETPAAQPSTAAQPAATEGSAAQAAAAAKADREAQEKAAADAAAAAKADREAQEKAAAEATARAQADAEAEKKRQEEARVAAQRQEEEARASAQAAADEKKRQQEEAQASAKAAEDERRAAAQAAAEQKKRQQEEAQASAQSAAEEKKRQQEEAQASAKAAADEKKRQAQAAAEERQAQAQAAADERKAQAEAAADARRQRQEEARASRESAKQEKLAVAETPRERREVTSSGGEVSVSSRRKTMTLVGFQQQSGASRVFIRTNEPVRYTASEDGRSVVVELENTRIDLSNNTRPLDTSFFSSPVTRVEADSAGRGVRVTINLRQQVAFQARQEGNVISLDFPRAGR
ncbi:AMIN domain-containing protein [Pyxidicoccus parkwayensis]|uniref:AMIN domain-containing protein n=1 Tax=Pyxidicoccus parkwayensis TaxID=2813578 RepID=A0ABX7PBD9_9BACT|nr:AMIN domain-containing protein [Pyxidicoccus parkwaysis]QSQ27753.1 AMIN domain-containing protein [Pyxidicoccus parkwaysis]